MKKWPGVEIKLGADCKIDDEVILGYPTGRSIPAGIVRIGSHAVIRSGSIIYSGVTIGKQFETGHYVIVREENILGDSVQIWTHSVIDYGCRIGNDVKIHTKVYIAQYSIIEDGVFIAPGVTFANDKYPVSNDLQGPRIKRGARIGVNVILLPGVVVGEEALVGAGCVVTKDVPDRAVVVGNPSRIVSTIEELAAKRRNS